MHVLLSSLIRTWGCSGLPPLSCIKHVWLPSTPLYLPCSMQHAACTQDNITLCCHVLCCHSLQVQFCLSDAAVQLPELRSVGLPNQLLLAAHEAWMQARGGQRLTSFHKEVHDALQQVGASHDTSSATVLLCSLRWCASS
jgi:hypothetical protein